MKQTLCNDPIINSSSVKTSHLWQLVNFKWPRKNILLTSTKKPDNYLVKNANQISIRGHPSTTFTGMGEAEFTKCQLINNDKSNTWLQNKGRGQNRKRINVVYGWPFKEASFFGGKLKGLVSYFILLCIKRKFLDRRRISACLSKILT